VGAPPDEGLGGLLVKITDFGLSKDKKIEASSTETVMMTGCGSVLWSECPC
jgi:hypothetical protein